MTSKAERGVGNVGKDPRTTPFVRRTLYAMILFLAAAAAFQGSYSKGGFAEGYRIAGFEVMIDGSADRPYIYRRLIPELANLADSITPNSLRQKLSSLHSDDGRGFYAALFTSQVALNPVYSFRYLVLYLAAFSSAILAVFFFYMVCRSEGHSPEISLISSSFMILLIPYIQARGGGYFYDYLEAACITLAVLLARRAHWLFLVPVALLGTLNKESFILVILTLWPLLKERSGRLVALVQVG